VLFVWGFRRFASWRMTRNRPDSAVFAMQLDFAGISASEHERS
jgi:hypothetical protein